MPKLVKPVLRVVREETLFRCPLCDNYTDDPIDCLGLSGLGEYDKILLSIIEILKASGATSEEVLSAINMALNRMVRESKQKGKEEACAVCTKGESRSGDNHSNTTPELRQVQAPVPSACGCRQVCHDGSRQPESCDGAKMPALQIPPKRLD